MDNFSKKLGCICFNITVSQYIANLALIRLFENFNAIFFFQNTIYTKNTFETHGATKVYAYNLMNFLSFTRKSNSVSNSKEVLTLS